ncbi:hypothetical protein, partial [Escherichia coli]|uniref:hypothetical protein n=1 Tax=Escherichia coli TaxID=562 RepID=UPI0029056203
DKIGYNAPLEPGGAFFVRHRDADFWIPMTKTLAPVLAAAAVLGLAAPALAGAPQPARPAPLSFYSGRWYEIARFPNTNQ